MHALWGVHSGLPGLGPLAGRPVRFFPIVPKPCAEQCFFFSEGIMVEYDYTGDNAYYYEWPYQDEDR